MIYENLESDIDDETGFEKWKYDVGLLGRLIDWLTCGWWGKILHNPNPKGNR